MQLDTERATYGLRESAIGEMYIKVLGLAKNSEAAQRIKNFRNPKHMGKGAVLFQPLLIGGAKPSPAQLVHVVC